MLLILSPAKTMIDEAIHGGVLCTYPRAHKETTSIIKILKKYSVAELAALMKMSEKLAEQNHQRFRDFDLSEQIKEGIPAILAYQGEVYQGLGAQGFTQDELIYAQNHLRILSGLYGVLRPLDAVQPYRLEIGGTLKVGEQKSLYAFWDKKINKLISEDLKECKHQYLINLASDEYTKVLHLDHLNVQVVQVQFLVHKDGVNKFVSFFAKKARGLLAAYIIKNKCKNIEGLLSFDLEGYKYEKSLSTEYHLTFVKY